LSFNLGEIKLSSMVNGGFVMRTDMAILARTRFLCYFSISSLRYGLREAKKQL